MRVFLAIMVVLLILLLIFAVQNPGSTAGEVPDVRVDRVALADHPGLGRRGPSAGARGDAAGQSAAVVARAEARIGDRRGCGRSRPSMVAGYGQGPIGTEREFGRRQRCHPSRGTTTSPGRPDPCGSPCSSPIAWRTPPRHYGPWEQVVSLLTEGLVRRGVDVTLFATGDSLTSARLQAVCPVGYEEDRDASTPRSGRRCTSRRSSSGRASSTSSTTTSTSSR